jgi:hypothetical protein
MWDLILENKNRWVGFFPGCSADGWEETQTVLSAFFHLEEAHPTQKGRNNSFGLESNPTGNS